MKLDRNVTGQNKYWLIKNRHLQALLANPVTSPEMETRMGDLRAAIQTLEQHGLIERGEPETENEFFVIKLRDAFAEGALIHYSHTAMIAGEQEYARDVIDLSYRSGQHSAFCKRPD